jgi:hypothetical protein
MGSMAEEWTLLLGYNPICHLLSRGCIGVIFRWKADIEVILAGQWYWDRHLFCYEPWHPLFDAREECISSFPIWIKLPNLPLEFWLEEGFKYIGEVLGSYITVDKQYKSSSYQSVAQILVDIDPRLGSFESLDIVMGDIVYTQQLDYLNVLINFSHCHRIGHLHGECDLSV